ncbi:MAG TPA: hypothetical protein VIL79_06580 [Thermoleophilia bacterium]
MSALPEFRKHDGLGLAELVRSGEVSPAELVDEATLYRLAGQLECAQPWAQRTPPGAA